MKSLVLKESSRKISCALISINVGWAHEPLGLRGISHFLEHAIFLGNEEYKEPDMNVGIYGVNLNGETLEDRTIFFFTSLEEDMDEILKILLSLVFKPSFNEDKVEEEKRSKILPAVVKEDDYYPWELAYEWARNLVFGWDFRYSMGLKDEIEKMDVEDLYRWHRRYYHKENSILILSSPSKLDMDIPCGGEKPIFQEIKYRKNKIVMNKNIPNAEIVYAIPYNTYDLRVHLLSIILGNYPTSLLWREFHRTAYMVDSRTEWHNGKGGFFIYIGASTRDDEKIRKEFKKFWENLKIKKEDVEIAKKILNLEMIEKDRSSYRLIHLLKNDPLLKFGGFENMCKLISEISIEDMKDFLHSLNMDDMVEAVVK